MKDRTARALAIVALVFMALFVAALVATLVDSTLLNGAVGYVALCCSVFALMIFIALKADGRGYSITKMNNEIEMKKPEEEGAAQNEKAAEAESAQCKKESAEASVPEETGAMAETTEASESEKAAKDIEPTENREADGD